MHVVSFPYFNSIFFDTIPQNCAYFAGTLANGISKMSQRGQANCRKHPFSGGDKEMKAIGFTRSLPITDAESLVDVEMTRPTTSGRDLLVKVRAVSVNPVDVKQ